MNATTEPEIHDLADRLVAAADAHLGDAPNVSALVERKRRSSGARRGRVLLAAAASVAIVGAGAWGIAKAVEDRDTVVAADGANEGGVAINASPIARPHVIDVEVPPLIVPRGLTDFASVELLRSEAENRVDLRRRVITGVCDGCDSPWRLDVVDASYPELQDLGSNETSVVGRFDGPSIGRAPVERQLVRSIQSIQPSDEKEENVDALKKRVLDEIRAALSSGDIASVIEMPKGAGVISDTLYRGDVYGWAPSWVLRTTVQDAVATQISGAPASSAPAKAPPTSGSPLLDRYTIQYAVFPRSTGSIAEMQANAPQQSDYRVNFFDLRPAVAGVRPAVTGSLSVSAESGDVSSTFDGWPMSLRQQLERGDLVELPVDLATCTPSVELPENLTCPLTEPPVPVG